MQTGTCAKYPSHVILTAGGFGEKARLESSLQLRYTSAMIVILRKASASLHCLDRVAAPLDGHRMFGCES